ncbi:hypothetical protein F5883DRAFT_7313 [Diaporthe sp. PMI_573]|nr:hypothetical protein F5883DRAFT_7313 [Diaporthaceae sp. PMI_573]
MEAIKETPVDTVEWPEESTSKKKKGKKGKKKNSIGAASLPWMAEPSAGPSSDVQQGTLIQEESVSKVIEEPSVLPHATTTSSEQTSQEATRPGMEPSFEETFPRGGEADDSSTLYQILGGNEGRGLTDDPQGLSGADEVSTIRDPVHQSQSQDDEPQAGGHSRRLSSDGRRLRSSRRSTLPHDIADRDGSPDIFHSGDDAPAFARSSPGQTHKKTRSLRSSRRSSLASAHGSDSGNGPRSDEALAFGQHGPGSDEHKQGQDVEQISPVQHEIVVQGIETPLEVVEQQVSSPLNVAGEHSFAQPGAHDEPEVKAFGKVDETASAQPKPFTGEVQRIGSPTIEDPQRGIEFAESHLQELTPTVVEHTSPTSPARAEEGSAEGLSSKPLDETPGLTGLRSLQNPLVAGEEALPPQGEAVLQENSPDELPTDVSGGKLQISEPDHAAHDDLQQKVEYLPPASPVEQTEEPSNRASVEEPRRDMPGSPPRQTQESSELEQSTAQDLPASEPQEIDPILASAEDDNSFFVKTSKKDKKKKRKSGTIIGEAIQPSDTAMSAGLESNTEPVESSVEPPRSHQDDAWLEESSSMVKETSLELAQQPGSTEPVDPRELSKAMEPESGSSWLAEPTIPVSEDKSPLESLHIADTTVFPVLDDVPAEAPISELEKPGLESQEKSAELLDEDEIARREAEADLIRDEEAEMSRLLSKKKLKPKEKTRLKQLKAIADIRADEAAAAAKTTPQPDMSEGQGPGSPIQQPVAGEATSPVAEEPILTKEEATAGSSTLITDPPPPQPIVVSEDTVPASSNIVTPVEQVSSHYKEVPGTSSTFEDAVSQLDESTRQREPRPEMEMVEDAEDLARREAEVALIRDEEAELSRLENKKKPNKKDKARMKVLRSNSEQRAREAESFAQQNIEEQDAAELEMPIPKAHTGSSSQLQGEDSTRDPASQETREMSTDDPLSFEDVIQTSDQISASTHPHIDSNSSPQEGDLGAENVGESSETQLQTQELSQPQAAPSPDEATAGTGPSQFEESLVEQPDQQAKPESTQRDNAQIPQILVEDTSSQLDPLHDEKRSADTLESETKWDSQPHVEGSVREFTEAQPLEGINDMAGAQIESSSQARDDGLPSEVQEDVVATGIHPEQASQAPAQEPILASDLPETDRGANTSSPFGESEQPAVTVTELPQDAESEWPVTTKKSKKDKKKKRKGTLSDGSGQNFGTVTPFFDASEQSPVVESRNLSETVPGGSGGVPQPSSFESEVIEQSQQPSASLALDDDKFKDFQMETTADQSLEVNVPDQQDTSLSVGESIPAQGFSSDHKVRDLMEKTTADQPLESTVQEPSQAEPEQIAFDEEPGFKPVSKKSRKDKKKKRKNTIPEDTSLDPGLATPIASDEPEQPSSLAETSGILEDERATTQRSSMPLDLTADPGPMPSTIEETLAKESPVMVTAQSAEEQSLPRSVSGEQPSTSPNLEEISTRIPEPEPEQHTHVDSEEGIKREKSQSGTVSPVNEFGEPSFPSEPAAIQETNLGSTQEPVLPLVQPSEPERMASSDFTDGPPVPTEHEDVHPPAHLPESEERHSTSRHGSGTERPHVELDKASLPSRKSDGWGFLAGAIAGAGVATTFPEGREKSPERDASPEDVSAGHSPLQTVVTDTHAPRPSFSFADAVETASASGPKGQEQCQATDISPDQARSVSFTVGERGPSDDNSQEPRPIQQDTSDVTIAPEESQEKEPAGRSLDVVDIPSPSTQIPLEKDTKQEEVLTSNDLTQDPGNFKGVAADLQSSPPEGQATPSGPQPQLDDWTQASSSKKKKKKDKKRKNSSIPWSEAESGAQTPVAEEPSEARDGIIDIDERQTSLDVADLVRSQDRLAKHPEPEAEAEVRATEERIIAPLAGDEIGEPVSLEGVPQPETTEIAGDTLASPDLHSTGGDRGDTSVAGGNQALDDLGPGQIQKDVTISSPVLDSKVDNRNEQVVPATPPREETLVSTGQAQEPSDHGAQEHDGLAPEISSASTDAFATPLQLPTVPQEDEFWAAPVDDQPLDLSAARDSSNDDTQTGIGLSRSFEPETESPTTVHQITAEPADTPAEQNLEPTSEDLWETIPKKLSKKEKRKAKKGSLSTSVPELTTATPENDTQISKGPAPDILDLSSQQRSPILGQGDDTLEQDVDKIDLGRSLEPESEPIHTHPQEEQPSQVQKTSVEETPVLSRKTSKKERRKAKKASLSAWEDDIAEPVELSQSQPPITVETQAQDIPTTSSPIMDPELGQKEPTQLSVSDEPQLEKQVYEETGPSIAKDVTAEEEWAAPISRKKSKKDKKKKGKQSSSGSVSGNQTPAVVEAPIVHAVEAVESGEPVSEPSATTVVPTGDISGSEDRNDPRSSETITSVPDNNSSDDKSSDRAVEDTSASQGHRDHRSAELYLPLGGANDQTLIGSSRDASTPSHHSDHRSAEFYVPGGERSLEVQGPTIIEDDWDIPSDGQSKNSNKATSSWIDRTPTLSTTMKGVHHTDKYLDAASRKDAESSKFLRSPDSRGKELEKMQPSPDLWDDEDYFKPKPANLAAGDQEPFTKFDIHPAVTRGLNTSPDRRVGEERPLVGLGLIHRHSSIFREDEGHVPKLLTMTSDNVSTDSVAIQETEEAPPGESSQLGALTRSATVPERPGSSRYYDEGLNPAVKQVNTKQWFTFETGPAHGANVPLARSVSPDNLRPISPGLPRSPQFPPPRSPQLSPGLSPQPSPRSPHFPPQPSPRSPQYSPRDSSSFEAARDPSKKGSVAALAERFGGGKKATGKTQLVSDYVDNHTFQEDDLFDEPAMREGAEHKPLQGSRLDVDSGDSWAVPDTNLEEEQSDPDMQNSGQGAAATSHGREPTTPGSDNVSEPRSQPDIDAGKFTPQISDQESREAEIPLESVVVESPVLGSQPSVDYPIDEQQSPVTSPRESPEAGPNLPEIREEAALHEFSSEPQVSSEARSRSPALQNTSSFEEPIPTIETEGDDPSAATPSAIDFSRSLPRELAPVQEEPHEEEAESSGHILAAKPRAVTPDINRDSGVVTGSPVPPRVHHFESAQQQRDSGVHMREPSGASPRLLGTRAFSPQPARLSHSSIEDDGANFDQKSSNRSSATESETQRRFREATPVLEAQDAPVTPEPRKNTYKSRKYPDLGPSPGKKAAAAAALAGGGALLAAGATRSRSPSPSPSPAASQRSVSDNTDELRASALPRQRRAASSNTGISRSRTPEPLNIRPESPSMLRHSGTPPLRSRRSRSGDLRSLSQLSNRSHSDLGARASSPASAVSAANKAPAHLPKAPTPASSDLRRATTPAAVAQGTTNVPTANEGRVRSKDMADVYVSCSFN